MSSENRPQRQLNFGHVSQGEAIGQSLAGIAPTATPAMIVPLVLMASGSCAWMTFLLATLGMLCMARQINVFARRSASAGSLYSFVHGTLGTRTGLTAGWALLIAYVTTASAASAGFALYLQPLWDADVPAYRNNGLLIMIAAVCAASLLACRGVHLSTRLMLIIEFSSIAVILSLFCYPGARSIWRLDHRQLTFTGESMRQIGGGLALAIFSLVGFESAAALGGEAKSPLKTIPRAIWYTALISGLLFTLSAYAESVGFQGHVSSLGDDGAPLQLLARLRGLSLEAPILALGSVCSFFACILACSAAAARLLFQMGRDGYMPDICTHIHSRYKTPFVAVALVGGLVLSPLVALAWGKSGMLDIYGRLGEIATFGFLTAYLLVLVSSIRVLSLEPGFTLTSGLPALGAGMVIALAVWGSLSSEAGGSGGLPCVYVILLLLGACVSAWFARARPTRSST